MAKRKRRPDRNTSCERDGKPKEKLTKQQAIKKAWEHEERYKTKVRYYRCRFCFFQDGSRPYHVGRPPKTKG